MHILIKEAGLFLSEKFKIAVKILVWLTCRKQGGYVRVSRLSYITGLAKSEVRTVIRKLTRYRILNSKRGWGGGIALAMPPEEISLRTVREIVDEENGFKVCLNTEEERARHGRISLHMAWHAAKAKVLRESARFSLAQAARKMRRRKRSLVCPDASFFLNRLYSAAA